MKEQQKSISIAKLETTLREDFDGLVSRVEDGDIEGQHFHNS